VFKHSFFADASGWHESKMLIPSKTQTLNLHLLISAPLTFSNTYFKIISGVVMAMDSSRTEKVHYLEDWRSQLD